MNIMAVFLGGGLGAVIRYITSFYALKLIPIELPIATFAVNIVGCLALGFLYAIFIDKPDINSSLKLALTTGFCGGLTTFSTFSFEVFEMVKNAQFLQASIYLMLSIILGCIAVWIGVSFGKII